jgi:predicted exporter
MAILTTACGSLALLFADFPGLVQLGMLTMVGILAAGAMTYWVLPLWIPAAMVRVPEALDRRPGVTVPSLSARARWGALLALAILVAAFPGTAGSTTTWRA